MRYHKVYLLLIFFLAIFGVERPGRSSEKSTGDYYLQGLECKKNQDWMKALQIWLGGGQMLQRQEKSDPRIGIAFIELVTEHSARKYYKLACNMYNWGFSGANFVEYEKDLEQEIRRLKPLMSNKRYAAWRRLLKNNDSAVCQEIRAFWLNKDPTPSTEINERLLEHWERIAYARRNFNKASSSVYRTDDRGLIYVKYGQPDRIKKGTLGGNRSQLKAWTDIILDDRGDGGFESSFGSSATSRAIEQTLLLKEIDRFNNYPDYEIWFYHSLCSEETLFFMFGNDEGIGPFGLRNGVEDFIPPQAFMRTSTRRTNGILPGAVLQSLFYSQLMHLDSYFENRYYDLEYVWNSFDSGRASKLAINNILRSKRRHFELLDRSNPAVAKAPLEKSDFDETVSQVELLVHPFRFLDEKNSPMVALMTFSFPRIKGRFVELTANKTAPEYSIVHTLMVYDDKKAETQRLTDVIPIGLGNISTLMLPHVKSQYEYSVVAEVYGESVPSNGAEATKQIIGVGKKTVPATAPLAVSSGQLELSDLLIGVHDSHVSGNDRIPFPVIPSSKIWATDSLQIYLEIYHLYFDSESMAHFRLDFEIARLKGTKKNKKESIALSFGFDSPTRTSKENFTVDISKLLPGNYELTVNVTDEVSSQVMGRKAFFEIRGDGENRLN